MTDIRKDQPEDMKTLLTRLVGEEYCYLSTTGRVTGKQHTIEIWFGLNGNSLYLLSGGMDKADWVKNLRKDPSAVVRIGKSTFHATARIVTDEKEEMIARYLLAEKYQEWEDEGTLSEWARTALPVAIDIVRGG